MKNKLLLSSSISITLSLLLCLNYSLARQAIIQDVRGEIFEDSAEIIIEANSDIEYLDYTLQSPPRIIIDPIGKIYTDLKESIDFDQGPVKNVSITKGRPEEGLTGDYYPIDFISIELDEIPEYSVKKEIKRETIVVNIGRKEKLKISKFVPEPEVKELAREPEVLETYPVIEEPVIDEALVDEEADGNLIPLEDLVVLPPSEKPRPKAEPKAAPGPVKKAAKAQEVEIIPLSEMDDRKVIPLIKEAEVQVPIAAGSIAQPMEFMYTIGEGDELDISVWQHDELDKEVVVRPDGYISFPLVGDVKAKDLTPVQLSIIIKEYLSRMIRDPQVTVIVSNFGSKNIFVLGEVTKPGTYSYRGGMSILDAVGAASGWKDSAVLNSVVVVRKAFTEAPEAHRLNVYALIKKGDFSQNLALRPGDIIYVPKSFIANIGAFVDNLKVGLVASITENTTFFD